MTFIVRGIRGEDATTAVRLRADTAVAKARDLGRCGLARISSTARMATETILIISTICFLTQRMIASYHCDIPRSILVLPSDA